MYDDERQAVIDGEHLKLLRWGYLLSAAMTALFSLFGLLYAAMGFMVPHFPIPEGQTPPPEWFGRVFAGFGIAVTLVMLTVAAAKLRVAKALRERRLRTFCVVVAVITMLGFPVGTFLGILTLIVLGRPSVERLFEAEDSAPAAPEA